VDGLESGLAEHPSPHDGLIRDDHRAEPGLAQAANRLGGSGHELHGGRIGEVISLLDDRAVAIEDDETTGSS
jgi:hypothetical protein